MLLSCGDALIDFLPVKSVDGRDALVPVAGGSCLNIAVGMARLGAPAGFVGGISTDLFGRMIADHAISSQVELRYATRGPRPETGSIGAAPSPSIRLKPFMSGRQRLSTTTGQLRRSPCSRMHAD